MAGAMTQTDLTARAALPDALRVLVAEIPRETWAAHPQFGGTVRFWLERHLMFRDLMDRMTAEAREVLDGAMPPGRYRRRLARHGSLFVGELQMHHHVEDAHYFPRLARLDARVTRAFDILDADHHALDAMLAGFDAGANAVLRAPDDPAVREAAGAFHDGLTRLHGFLDRHLTDEEEIVVPVILASGFDG